VTQGIEVTVGGQRASAGPALASRRRPVLSLYVHVPFCFHKCHYCDFYSLVDRRDRQDPFTDALVAELRALAPHAGPLESVFVGGGTPTLLRPDLWRRLLDAFHGAYRLAPDAEFTVECNPETASPELMGVLAAGGVNRLSVGAQSFDERHLKTLERWHDPASVPRALALAHDAGIHRLSVDLIFAIPGQTLDDWRRDLDAALALPVEHLSGYGLTYEPGTAMTTRLERGDVEPAGEDLEAAMYEATLEAAAQAGFRRYEVSNLARAEPGEGPTPRAASRHNLAYWRGESWLAAGPSASAHVEGWRWKNVPRVDEWMAGVRAGGSPVVDLEPPDERRALAERLMMGLRLAEGIDTPVHAGALRAAIERERGAGLLDERDGRLTLTERGFLLADGVIARLIDAI
jgi:oxygen-independent coproporphyrinogen-3 oxidase